jgi:hydrogenase maturation protein HypF
VRIQVEGIVQGVGFRPFVHREATTRGLAGFVRNDERGARIEVEGATEAVEAFLDGLAQRRPALARIDRIERKAISLTREVGFRIETSDASGERHAPISPDIATCDACVAELFDPDDRRHRYPFTNCTACGPRYSIVRSVPYDRPATTMSGFVIFWKSQ